MAVQIQQANLISEPVETTFTDVAESGLTDKQQKYDEIMQKVANGNYGNVKPKDIVFIAKSVAYQSPLQDDGAHVKKQINAVVTAIRLAVNWYRHRCGEQRQQDRKNPIRGCGMFGKNRSHSKVYLREVAEIENMTHEEGNLEKLVVGLHRINQKIGRGDLHKLFNILEVTTLSHKKGKEVSANSDKEIADEVMQLPSANARQPQTAHSRYSDYHHSFNS